MYKKLFLLSIGISFALQSNAAQQEEKKISSLASNVVRQGNAITGNPTKLIESSADEIDFRASVRKAIEDLATLRKIYAFRPPTVRDVAMPQASPGEQDAWLEREKRRPTGLWLREQWEMSQELEGGAWRAIECTPEQQAAHDARWPQPKGYNPYELYSADWKRYNQAREKALLQAQLSTEPITRLLDRVAQPPKTEQQRLQEMCALARAQE